MERRRKMTPERKAFIDSLLEHYQPSDVQDVQEMLKDLLGDTLQGMLEAEMDQKLGYSKYDYQNKDTDDSRNGYSHKTVTSSMGDIELDIPRDRKGEFEPQIVKKHQTDISNIEDQVLSMYAKGMTTRDFSTHLHDVYGVDSQKDDPVIDYLEKESIPFVLVGKTDRSIHDTIYVDNDNILAGKDTTNYLLDLGHTPIGYLGSLSVRIYSADQKSGYILALTEAGIPYDPAMCIELPSIPKEGADELTEFLSSENRPTALVVSDDIIAMVIEITAYELGLRIPEDLSIVSFNNSLFAKLSTPQLTSIDVNNRQLGIEAAFQMINHIENPALLATKIIVPYYLVERQSCCPPKQ